LPITPNLPVALSRTITFDGELVMAVTRTTRFALHRWDSGADSFNREQNDTDNRQLEALAALFRTGLDTEKGSADAAAYARSFYYASDTSLLYFSDGVNWVTLNSFSVGANIQDLPVGSTNSAGSANAASGVKNIKIALADHVHATPDSAIPIAVGTTLSEGIADTIALSDHVHIIGTGAITAAAQFAGTPVDASVIASGAVTEAKIASGAVTETKIGSAAVTEAKLGTGAVTADKLGTGAVTPLKVNSTIVGASSAISRNAGTGVLTVAVDGTTIEISGNTIRVVDGSIVEAKLGTGAVTATKIGSGAVTGAKLAAAVAGKGLIQDGSGNLDVNPDNSTLEIPVDSLQIKALGVGTSHLAATSVTEAKIAGLAVTETKIGGLAVTEAKIAGLAVTETKIGGLAVTEGKIGTGAVTPLKIGSGIVGGSSAITRNVSTGVLSAAVDGTTLEINSNAIRVKDDGVAAVKLKSDVAGAGLASTLGVLSVNVDASTIEIDTDTLRVKAGGIDTTQIATGAVTEDKIDTDAVTEGKIYNGSVTVNKIDTGAVTPLKIHSTIVGASSAITRNVSTGVLTIAVDDSTIEINTNAIRVKNGGVTAVKLNADVAGNGLTSTSGVLSVNVDANTMVITSDIVGVKNGGIDTTQIATGAVTGVKTGAGTYRNATSTTTGGQVRYGTAAVGTIGGSPTSGDLYLRY
jgi:hypothetical protein